MFCIKTFQVNPLQENCFIVNDETSECVIIDCGAYYEDEQLAIKQYIIDNKLTPVHLLCTHGHFDHIFGNTFVHNLWGLEPKIHFADASFLENFREQCNNFGIPINTDNTIIPIGKHLHDGDIISFGKHHLHITHTPGHSPGSIFLFCKEENIAFSGDTLFHMSVGRTDLPGGSWDQLMKSIESKIKCLPLNTRIYPGHGPQTTISEEFLVNPYLVK